MSIIRKNSVVFVLSTIAILFLVFLGMNYVVLRYNQDQVVKNFHKTTDLISQTSIETSTLYTKYSIIRLVYKDGELIDSPQYYPSALIFDYKLYDENDVNKDSVSSFVCKFYIIGDEVTIYKQNIYLGVITNNALFNVSLIICVFICAVILRLHYINKRSKHDEYNALKGLLNSNIFFKENDIDEIYNEIRNNSYKNELYKDLLSYDKNAIALFQLDEKLVLSNERAEFFLNVGSSTKPQYKYEIIQTIINDVKNSNYESGEFEIDHLTFSYVCFTKELNERKFIVLFLNDESDNVRFKNNQITFFNQASHELRTPLTTICGYVQLMMLVELDLQTKKDTLDACFNECRKMEQLISSIIDISKRFKKSDLYVKTNITSLIEHYIEVHKTHFDVKLNKDFQPNVMLICNPLRVGLVLSSLIKNAYEHNIRGGFIDVELIQSQRGIELTIVNSTKELILEEVERVFEPFFKCQYESDSGIVGNGLGLCLVETACNTYNFQVFHKYYDKKFEIKLLFYADEEDD